MIVSKKNMTFFCSKSRSAFETPDSLDWFKKNETKLKQNSNTFNHSLFFSSKKLLLIVANYCFAKKYAIIVNMTLFFSKFSPLFEFPDSLDWFKKKWNELKTNFKQFQSVAFFFASKCFSFLLIIFIQSFRHCINQVLVSEVSSQSRLRKILRNRGAKRRKCFCFTAFTQDWPDYSNKRTNLKMQG